MDEPIPIEGIVEGDPEVLAAVCAAGGSAVIAYCAVVGATAYVAEAVISALGDFRRGVVEHADQEPSQLQKLLLSATDDAVQLFAGVAPPPDRQAAAQAALEGAETTPLAPGLAPRIIRALVEAAPVTALGGDAIAVRRAAEQHYKRTFDRPQTPAAAPRRAAPPPPAAAPTPPPAPALAPPPAAAPTPAASRPPALAAWVPPELGDGAANVPAVTPNKQWNALSAAREVSQPQPQPEPDAPLAPGAVPPPAPPPPGALIIKRGGHWPSKWPRLPQRRSTHGGGSAAAPTRNLVVAGVTGLLLGAGIAAVATPEKTVRPDPILVRPLDTPFTVQGAVFNVARTSNASWALQIRRRAPRAGRTWLTLAAQTRNVSRTDFRPRGLGYRLRTPAGVVIGPDTALVAGEIPALGGHLPTGKRTSVHLGFQVPRGQRDLTLEFDPAPGAPLIRVPLN